MGLFPAVRGYGRFNCRGTGASRQTLFALGSILNAAARPLSWGVRRWVKTHDLSVWPANRIGWPEARAAAALTRVEAGLIIAASLSVPLRLRKIMLLNSRNLGVAGVLLPAIFTFLVVATPAWAQTESVLYNFCSVGDLCADGAYPIAPLTSDGTGNFYGTTHSGGQSGTYGAVFELSPNGKGGWNETVLHSFTLGSDGAYPVFSPVVFDSAGNLYGTTEDGGAGYGVVFELSPFEKSWAEKAIYTFKNSGDGGSPQSGVTVDASGNLFGVTPSGGPGNSATVFELSPSGSTWTEQVIYTFDNSDIIAPSGLAIDSRGNIFGAANLTVFELSPDGTGGWNPTTLHVFPDQG